jgi:hypothetical protein
VGSVATAPHKGESVDNSKTEEDGPDEEAKDDGSDGNAPATSDDGEGDASGEPEDGGDDEQDESDEGVEKADGEARDDGQVDEDKKRPDDSEEEEAELGGRAVPVPAVPSVDDCAYAVSDGYTWGQWGEDVRVAARPSSMMRNTARTAWAIRKMS